MLLLGQSMNQRVHGRSVECLYFQGECRRGEECPYRHEKPSDPDDPLSEQNIVDRFYGTKDPVAEKLLRRAEQLPSIKPPDDKTITTLWVLSTHVIRKLKVFRLAELLPSWAKLIFKNIFINLVKLRQ